MASFEFTPIADYVTVTYFCPHLGPENTIDVQPVPVTLHGTVFNER